MQLACSRHTELKQWDSVFRDPLTLSAFCGVQAKAPYGILPGPLCWLFLESSLEIVFILFRRRSVRTVSENHFLKFHAQVTALICTCQLIIVDVQTIDLASNELQSNVKHFWILNLRWTESPQQLKVPANRIKTLFYSSYSYHVLGLV